ncbi:hypothetical protein [uncultured Imperialibacter sp.]|uniref:hypothetical protein n=1 Tax=Imperialibacter sp. TaxID=2038411 RepID=UPI0030D70188|tara:strand:+ start:1378 stop:1650 length:273 start_codon:yes stop_codon:yes gene_type:complete
MSKIEIVTSKELAPFFIDVVTKNVAIWLAKSHKISKEKIEEYDAELEESRERLMAAISALYLDDQKSVDLLNFGVNLFHLQIQLTGQSKN